MPLRKFDKELVQELERLLRKARAGEIRGIVYTVETEPGRHIFGMSRTYADDPAVILKLASRVSFKLNMAISAMEGEPTMSGAMPLW